jgi:hypothetical protein
VEEMKNPDQMQQPIEKSLWLMHTTGLWTHVVDSGTWTSRGLKKIANDMR